MNGINGRFLFGGLPIAIAVTALAVGYVHLTHIPRVEAVQSDVGQATIDTVPKMAVESLPEVVVTAKRQATPTADPTLEQELNRHTLRAREHAVR